MVGRKVRGAGQVCVVGAALSAVLAVNACGGSSSNEQPPQAQAGTSSGGQGDSGAPSAGAPPVPDDGACLETLRLEGTPADKYLDVSKPTRLQDGFVLFESNTKPEFGWFVGSELDVWHDMNSSPGFFPYLRPVAVGSAQNPQLVLFNRQMAQGFDAQLVAQAVRADGSAVAPLAPVLSIFDRGTAAYPTASSLDGERVAVGNGHVATRDPHFVLLDKDAQPVSDEIRLLDTGDKALFDCFALTATAHGVLASVVDLDAQQIHVLELDASGARVGDATAAAPDGAPCPIVTVDPTGNYLAFQGDPGVTDPAAIVVYRFANDALTTVATLPSAPEQSRYSWVTGGADPLIAVFDRSVPNGPISFARLRDGAQLPLSGAFAGQRVPSADGRIFLASSEPVDPADTTTVPPWKFKVVEVACGASRE